MKTTRTIRDTKYVHYVERYNNYYKVGDIVACFVSSSCYGATKRWNIERIRSDPDLNVLEWGITKEKAMSKENFVGFHKIKSIENCDYPFAKGLQDDSWVRIEIDRKEINL